MNTHNATILDQSRKDKKRKMHVRANSIVAQTAGIIKTNGRPFTAKQLRELGEIAIAEAALRRS